MHLHQKLFPLAALAALVSLPLAAQAADSATYEITFTPGWTAKTHPLEYPKQGILTGPHFSGLIGATHGAGYEVFKVGRAPTPGLERLSEMGKHDPLDEEIKAAIAKGSAGALFETDAVKDFSKTAKATVTVNDKYPMVSVVAMIAPSPDWFAGVADVNLKDGSGWVASKTLDVFAYDSGGDDGTTYEADDKDTNPKKATSLNNAPHFVQKGTRVPVGKITFVKK